MILACTSQILSEFSDDENGGCESHSILFPRVDSINGDFLDEVSCHFKNQITVYAYQEDEKILIDLKGFSDQKIQGHELEVDHTEEFFGCEDLSERVREVSQYSLKPFGKVERRIFNSYDNVLIVASESNCKTLSSELKSLRSQYEKEGRVDSKLFCVADSVLKKRNPAQVRALISVEAKASNGILLVGSDLPPFEFFFRTQYGEGWGAYGYGTTDLPYGNFDDEFWAKPLKKTSNGISEVVYRSKDFMYPMIQPTPYTFDLDRWVQRELSANSKIHYQQQRWVSRWLSPASQSAESFDRFINRRRDYSPPQSQHIIYARGGESFMMTPGKSENYAHVRDNLSLRISTLPPSSEVRIYSDGDLEQLVRFVSPHSTFLILDEHGQPEALGNLNAAAVGSTVRGFPEIFQAHSCLVGAWGYASSVDQSFVAKTFSTLRPPLAMIASQGLLGSPTIEVGADEYASPFLTYWRVGQSLGNRQVESLNLNLESWRNYVPWTANYVRAFSAGQIFNSTSIFGDGTIEF